MRKPKLTYNSKSNDFVLTLDSDALGNLRYHLGITALEKLKQTAMFFKTMSKTKDHKSPYKHMDYTFKSEFKHTQKQIKELEKIIEVLETASKVIGENLG
jgi:CO dehydrogenase nickel-insertion accessory protein CooC1